MASFTFGGLIYKATGEFGIARDPRPASMTHKLAALDPEELKTAAAFLGDSVSGKVLRYLSEPRKSGKSDGYWDDSRLEDWREFSGLTIRDDAVRFWVCQKIIQPQLKTIRNQHIAFEASSSELLVGSDALFGFQCGALLHYLSYGNHARHSMLDWICIRDEHLAGS